MKKKNFVKLGGFCVVLVVLVSVCGMIFKKNDDSDKPETSIDLDKYIGYWYEEEEDCGQDYVYIKDVQGNEIIMDVFVVREYGEEDLRIAIVGGYGEFETDVSYGSIEFIDNKVIFKVNGLILNDTERSYEFIYQYDEDIGSCEYVTDDE